MLMDVELPYEKSVGLGQVEEQIHRVLSGEIRGLLAGRLHHISQHYPRVRLVLRSGYRTPELDELREEAALCTILGLDRAAVRTINDLLQTALRLGVLDAGVARELAKASATDEAERLLLNVDAAIRGSLKAA